MSRVSNKAVFQTAGVQPLTEQVFKRQLILLGQVARAPPGDPLRKDVFVAGSLRPVISQYIRKVGRPKANWTEHVLKLGAERFGSEAAFNRNLQNLNEEEWRAKVVAL